MRQDALIIGAGFGGSVLAARLAQKGLRVTVLERGPWWGPAHLSKPHTDRRDFPRGLTGLTSLLRNIRTPHRETLLRTTGLWEIHHFAGLSAFTASGVGGGSLVYTNMQVQPPTHFFEHFPEALRGNALQPCFDRVRTMLRPSPLPRLPEKNQAFASALATRGLPAPHYPDLAIAWQDQTNAANVSQKACNDCGACILGCTYHAKTTLDLTYLPLAQQHGALVLPLCEALHITKRPQGYEIHYLDHRDKQTHTLHTDKLFLSAGTLNTLRLLFQARDAGLSITSPLLGKRFSPNGDMAAWLARSPSLQDASRGPSLNAYLPQQHGTQHYALGEFGLPLDALPLPTALRKRLATHTLLLCMGQDKSLGEVSFNGKHIEVSYQRALDKELYQAMEDQLEEIASAYHTRRVFLNIPAGRGAARLSTVHPIGGASLGDNPTQSVVGPNGEVFGCPGLYVADGSLYPAAPGLPPSMTIAALAEHIAAQVA